MTISVGIRRVVVLMVTVTVRVHSRASPHGSIHSKRRVYAVYYCRMGLQLISHESAAII
jgi:hypothetical protein